MGKIRQVNGVLVVDLAGPLDAATAQQVKSELQALIDGGNVRLVLNLSRMDFIDSAGLGVLVSCLRRAAGGGGDLRLADVPPFCRSIFELTRLTRVFDVNESEEQAIRAIQQ